MLKQQRGAVRAVMDMSLFVMLLLSGFLCCSASGLRREYHYINQNTSWSEAQSYCREWFTDLATADSMKDLNRMKNAVNDGYSGSVWIGLKRGTQKRWGWSMGDDTLTQYSGWTQGNPSGDGECVFFGYGTWYNYACSTNLHFVCNNDSTGYVVIQMYKNWRDAQRYCRQYHTDLATVKSAEEQNQLYVLVGYGPWVWIGLFFDSWLWSDQWSLFFRNWVAGQPSDSPGSGDCVAMSTTDSRKWIHYSCDQQFPFICYGVDKLVKRQLIRLNLSWDGKINLNDPSLQTVILNKINEKMKRLLGSYNNITWRMDEGGEKFHMGIPTANSNIQCDGN